MEERLPREGHGEVFDWDWASKPGLDDCLHSWESVQEVLEGKVA